MQGRAIPGPGDEIDEVAECAYDWKLVTVPQPLGLWLCTVLVNDLGKSGPLRVSDNVVSTHISRVTWYSY